MDIIEFPKLFGLKFNISPIALNLMGISIYWYGIIIASALIFSLFLATRHSERFGIKSEDMIDLMIYVLPLAVIGARLYYVVFNYSTFNNDILKMINLRTGGLAIYGAILGAILGCIIFSKRRKVNLFKILDFGFPYVALGQAIGRWGNFVNQEAFGINTNLLWGMTGNRIKYELTRMQEIGVQINPNIPVHPTFLYESLWNFFIVFFLIWYRKRSPHRGEIFCLYMILYGLGRVWIESLRTDSLLLGNLRISQILSIIFIATFSTILYLIKKEKIVLFDKKTMQIEGENGNI